MAVPRGGGLAMRWSLCLLAASVWDASSSSAGERIVGGYCTSGSNGNNCNLTGLVAAADAVNAFSVTSYHLNASGLVSTCNANYTACGWDGDVETFSSDVQGASDGALTAIPLVFNNAGHMVSYFRTMAAEGNQQQVVDYLVAAAAEYGFEALSIDLEPSCWGGNASACEFPTSDDVAALHAFIDLLADGLHGAGRRLSVAAGSYPVAQCDNGFPQYELCADEYVSKCRDGTYNISTCNCCGFTSWFEPTGLCATKADRIVNMDTYMSPFDTAFFQDAMAWYYAAGCSAEQVAVGLLASETSDDGQVDEMFDAIAATGAVEVDIWSNFWSGALTQEWGPSLEAFLASGTGSPEAAGGALYA